MRFRRQLFLLVLSALIPAFIASACAVWYVYSTKQKEQERNLLEAARSFAMVVENELRVREATLRTLSHSPLLERGDLEAFYSYAKSMTPAPESTIILVHESGRQLLNTRRPLGIQLPVKSAANLEELRKSHGANDTVISDVFFAQVAKRFDFAIQVPVQRNNHSYSFLNMGSMPRRCNPSCLNNAFQALGPHPLPTATGWY